MSAKPLPAVQRRLLDYRGLAAYLSLGLAKAKEIGGPNGEIPRVNLGSSVRFDIADVDAWIERKKQSA